MRGRRFHGPRTRWRDHSGHWHVRGRVERFVEPAVLLLLSERSGHGYDLLDRLGQLVPERMDMGNLYRLLRALEEDGLVTSEWNAALPGPAKRTYALTDAGRELLRAWAKALRETQLVVDAFIRRYGEEVKDAPRT
jgi:PadR family transcriptional regulator, regulatory protein PadR